MPEQVPALVNERQVAAQGGDWSSFHKSLQPEHLPGQHLIHRARNSVKSVWIEATDTVDQRQFRSIFCRLLQTDRQGAVNTHLLQWAKTTGVAVTTGRRECV